MRPGLLVLLPLLIGCAHQGLPMPGPLGSLGQPVGREEAGVARNDPPPAKTAPTSRKARKAAAKAATGGEAVAKAAADMVGKSRLVVDGRTYRYDCSGLASAIYAEGGWTISGSTKDLYATAEEEGYLHHKKIPSPGDIAFFDDTYDANHNRRRDDDLSHVAVVESVDDDGTITLIHMGSHGVVRIRMNLKHPDEARAEDGTVLNDGLRAGKDDGGPRLSGELWTAFGSLWKEPPSTEDNTNRAVADR